MHVKIQNKEAGKSLDSKDLSTGGIFYCAPGFVWDIHYLDKDVVTFKANSQDFFLSVHED